MNLAFTFNTKLYYKDKISSLPYTYHAVLLATRYAFCIEKLECAIATYKLVCISTSARTYNIFNFYITYRDSNNNLTEKK